VGFFKNKNVGFSLIFDILQHIVITIYYSKIIGVRGKEKKKINT
jgi:hypothetical protein